MTHGYCVTSYSSQSKSVDCVFVAESCESFRAADREQFYVSVSRFKEALMIYTDDKYQLLESVHKSSHRPSALDLVTQKIAESTKDAKIAVEPKSGQKVEVEISKNRGRWQRQNAQQMARGVRI